jgi:hypothetical protein
MAHHLERVRATVEQPPKSEGMGENSVRMVDEFTQAADAFFAHPNPFDEDGKELFRVMRLRYKDACVAHARYREQLLRELTDGTND